MDTKISDKLDALLRMYYNSATTQGEKDNAMSLFQKICTKNNVDSTEYQKTSSGNPINEQTRRGRFNSSSRSNARPQNNSNDDDFENFWRDVRNGFGFGGFGGFTNNKKKQDDANEYRRRYQEQEEQRRKTREKEEADRKARADGQRRERERQYEEARRQQDQSKRWGTNQWGTLEFEMKEPLWEEKYHNSKRVILVQTLVRAKGTQNKWGTQNFCIYSENFDPKDIFNKTDIYIVNSGKVQYFRDHYVMERLWVLDKNGFECEIKIK